MPFLLKKYRRFLPIPAVASLLLVIWCATTIRDLGIDPVIEEHRAFVAPKGEILAFGKLAPNESILIEEFSSWRDYGFQYLIRQEATSIVSVYECKVRWPDGRIQLTPVRCIGTDDLSDADIEGLAEVFKMLGGHREYGISSHPLLFRVIYQRDEKRIGEIAYIDGRGLASHIENKPEDTWWLSQWALQIEMSPQVLEKLVTPSVVRRRIEKKIEMEIAE